MGSPFIMRFFNIYVINIYNERQKQQKIKGFAVYGEHFLITK